MESRGISPEVRERAGMGVETPVARALRESRTLPATLVAALFQRDMKSDPRRRTALSQATSRRVASETSSERCLRNGIVCLPQSGPRSSHPDLTAPPTVGGTGKAWLVPPPVDLGE